MEVRLGRHNNRNIYLQTGDEPSDDDEYLAAIINPAQASMITGILNGTRARFGKWCVHDSRVLHNRGSVAGLIFDPVRAARIVAVLNGELAKFC